MRFFFILNTSESFFKVPVLIIIGKQEAEKKQLSVRRLGSNDTETFDLKTITDALAKEAKAP